MPRVTDPALLSQLETPQSMINKGAGGQGAAPRVGLTGDARNQALQKAAALRLLLEQTNRSAQEFDRSQNGGSVVDSIREFLPSMVSPSNAKYDATVAGLTPLAKAAFRVPGSGADSDKESQAFMALLPSRYNSDAGNLERYKQMAQIIQSAIGQQRGLLGLANKAPAARPAGRAAAPQKSAEIDFNSLPE